MEPWIGRCGYYRMYGSVANWANLTGGGRISRTTETEPTYLKTKPFPVETLQHSRSFNRFTTFEKRALTQGEKQMASAGTIQSMKVSGRGLFSPELASMFPLILLAGLFVFIILKR